MNTPSQIFDKPKLSPCRSLGLFVVVTSVFLAACEEVSERPFRDRPSSAASVTENLLSSSSPPPARVPPGMQALARSAPPPSSAAEVTADNMGEDFGDLNAPVAVLEFFDYGCGYCRQFHLETLPILKEEYIETGQVHWKSMPFIMGNWEASVSASLASECAAKQGRFEEMASKIFDQQAAWKTGPDPEAVLEGFAAEIDLEMDSFRSCVSNDELLWRVKANTDIAQQFGVRSTPTFVVRGYGPIPGALPLPVFRQVLDTILSESGTAPN